MSEVLEIGEELVATGEYTEVLQQLLEVAQNIDTSLLGIYAVGWLLVGSIGALILAISLLSMFKT